MSDTTPEERTSWRDQSGHERNWLVRLLNDFDSQTARIAELEAALKETHTEAGAWQTQVHAAVLAEREACAKTAEDFGATSIAAQHIAAAIRARAALSGEEMTT